MNIESMKIKKIAVINMNRIVQKEWSSGMLRHVALVRTDVSEELSASFVKMTRIGELGTTLALTGNRRTLRRNTSIVLV
jgi:hypothetical protein